MFFCFLFGHDLRLRWLGSLLRLRLNSATRNAMLLAGYERAGSGTARGILPLLAADVLQKARPDEVAEGHACLTTRAGPPGSAAMFYTAPVHSRPFRYVAIGGHGVDPATRLKPNTTTRSQYASLRYRPVVSGACDDSTSPLLLPVHAATPVVIHLGDREPKAHRRIEETMCVVLSTHRNSCAQIAGPVVATARLLCGHLCPWLQRPLATVDLFF